MHSPVETAIPPAAPGRGSAYSAVRWLLAGSVAQRLVSVGALGIIARIVEEEHFGIYRELLAIHAVLFVLLPLGFDQLLARESAARPLYTKALRGALLLSTLAIGTGLLFAQTAVVTWLKIPAEFGWLIYAVPVVIALQAAKLRYKSPLAAQLAFRTVTTGDLINTVVSMSCSLILLSIWRHPGALYAGFALGEMTELIWLAQRQKSSGPADLRTDLQTFRSLARTHRRFSFFYCSDQVLNTVGLNMPVLLLAAFLGHAVAAGFSLATFLITLPLSLLIGALGQISLPALAGRSEEDLHARVLELLSGAAAVIVPLLLAIAVMARPLVRVVLGPTWVEGTAPMVQWLAIFGMARGLFSPISAIDILRDRMDLGLAWSALALVVRLGALLWAIPYGLVTAVAAYSLGSAAMYLLYGIMLGWLLRAGHWRFHRTWLRFVPLWGLLAIALVPCTFLPTWLALLTSVLPALLYGLCLVLFYPDTANVLARLLHIRRLLHPFYRGRRNPISR